MEDGGVDDAQMTGTNDSSKFRCVPDTPRQAAVGNDAKAQVFTFEGLTPVSTLDDTREDNNQLRLETVAEKHDNESAREANGIAAETCSPLTVDNSVSGDPDSAIVLKTQSIVVEPSSTFKEKIAAWERQTTKWRVRDTYEVPYDEDPMFSAETPRSACSPRFLKPPPISEFASSSSQFPPESITEIPADEREMEIVLRKEPVGSTKSNLTSFDGENGIIPNTIDTKNNTTLKPMISVRALEVTPDLDICAHLSANKSEAKTLPTDESAESRPSPPDDNDNCNKAAMILDVSDVVEQPQLASSDSKEESMFKEKAPLNPDPEEDTIFCTGSGMVSEKPAAMNDAALDCINEAIIEEILNNAAAETEETNGIMNEVVLFFIPSEEAIEDSTQSVLEGDAPHSFVKDQEIPNESCVIQNIDDALLAAAPEESRALEKMTDSEGQKGDESAKLHEEEENVTKCSATDKIREEGNDLIVATVEVVVSASETCANLFDDVVQKESLIGRERLTDDTPVGEHGINSKALVAPEVIESTAVASEGCSNLLDREEEDTEENKSYPTIESVPSDEMRKLPQVNDTQRELREAMGCSDEFCNQVTKFLALD